MTLSRVNSRAAVWELVLVGEGDLVEEEPDSGSSLQLLPVLVGEGKLGEEKPDSSIDMGVFSEGKPNGWGVFFVQMCSEQHVPKWDGVHGWIQKAFSLD